MTCDLFALCFEARDPLRLARFWGGVLGWEMTDDRRDDGVAVLPSDTLGSGSDFLRARMRRPARTGCTSI